MDLLGAILKKTAFYFWDEILYLTFFNFMIFIVTALGLGVIIVAWNTVPVLLLVPIMFLLLLIEPFLLFSLYWMAYDIGEGKAIKLGAIFRGGIVLFKEAYIWTAINVFVYLVLISNIVFYLGLGQAWSGYLALFLIGLGSMWTILQLFALSIYPRLLQPNFKEAQRNALGVLAASPGLTMTVIFLAAVVTVIGLSFPFIAGLVSISFVVLLINMTTEAIINRLRDREGEAVQEESGDL